MRDIKACIFDLDGVIVDTARHHFQAWRKLANELGFDFSEEQNEQLKGVGRMDSLNLILAMGGVDLPQVAKEALAAKKNEWYKGLIAKMDESEILPGVADFLKQIKAEGIKISLGSASKNAQTILERLGLVPLFDAIVDGRHTTRGKPDPQVFELGAEKLGIPAANCVVFEDAPKGVTAAKRAGMLAVGVGEAAVLGEADLVIRTFVGFSLALLPG